MSSEPVSLTPEEGDVPFDFRARVLDLRCASVESLRAGRAEARRQEQRWRLEGLAFTRALDERKALDDEPDPSVSARTAKTNKEVARSLEQLPKVAAAAWSGDLSWDQLQPVTQIATEETDAEWAVRARNMAPVDLRRAAQQTKTVTPGDAAKRREARALRTWRDHEQGMVAGKWWLPDVDGVLVDQVLEHMAERMRPEKGKPWDSLAHRKADALVELCTHYADVKTTKRAKPLVVMHLNSCPTCGPSGGEVDGIPLADTTVEDLLRDARVVTQDDAAPVVDYGDGRRAVPVALQRELARRDRHCRYPGCENSRALQAHHVDPVAWGGHTSRKHLVMLCPVHHRRMEPHGVERLVGDPDLPDGLRLIAVNQRARAGPGP